MAICPDSDYCKPIINQCGGGLDFGFYGSNFVCLLPFFGFYPIKSQKMRLKRIKQRKIKQPAQRIGNRLSGSYDHSIMR
jgi:hypothetical protein